MVAHEHMRVGWLSMRKTSIIVYFHCFFPDPRALPRRRLLRPPAGTGAEAERIPQAQVGRHSGGRQKSHEGPAQTSHLHLARVPRGGTLLGGRCAVPWPDLGHPRVIRART